ncbi:MAG: hypothetical protein LBE82_06370 [Chitinophagaceae bacterium]|jgi:hypothetical protein|nr:hypothetical protein [Chitinophagaceae bacterium]
MSLTIYKSFEDLSKLSYEYLYAQQELCEEKYLLSKHEKWFYDQETGLITFSNNGKPCIIFKFENVGSISYISNSWLWAWANSYCLKNVTTEILAVKELGQLNNFDKLYTDKWNADIYDGWEMTAIAAYTLKSIGVYRIPNEEENIFNFKLLTAIAFIDELELKKKKN